MKNNEYWVKRAEQVLLEAEKNTNNYLNQLNLTCVNTIESIDKEIKKIFGTYHKGFSEKQAKAWLNEEISEVEYKKLKDMLPDIEDERYKKELLMRLNAPAYRYRITRLEQIKQTMITRFSGLADKEFTISKQCFINTLNQSYNRTMFHIQQGAGLYFEFAQIPQATINRLLSSKWSGENFSKRIWKNSEIVANEVSKLIKEGVLSGQTIQQMSKSFMEKVYCDSMHNATRLIRTEVNYFCNQGALESYKEAELDYYEFCATLDIKTSEYCRLHDGKKYSFDDINIGENYPPLHPYCRSTVIPVINVDNLEKMNKRRVRDPLTGKNTVVDNMTYENWYKKYVSSDKKALLVEKMYQNQYSDFKQFEKYKEILGKNAPKSFAKFQDLKYNNSEQYEFVKLDYSRQHKLIKDDSLKLPNADKAIIADSKFTKYLFNENNPKGIAKGKALTNRLGYSIDNCNELQDIIKDNASKYPVTLKSSNEYGILYEQKQVVYGLKDKPANVIVGWLVNGSKTHMTSTYIKELKVNEN